MTNKAILAAVLAVILAAVLYTQCVILPMNRDITALEEEVSAAQFQLDTDRLTLTTTVGILSENEELKQLISKEKQRMLAGTDTELCESLITGYIARAGLAPISAELSATSANGIAVVTAEYYAEGSYSALIRLKDILTNDPAVSLTSVRMRSAGTESPAVNEEDMNFEMTVIALCAEVTE